MHDSCSLIYVELMSSMTLCLFTSLGGKSTQCGNSHMQHRTVYIERSTTTITAFYWRLICSSNAHERILLTMNFLKEFLRSKNHLRNKLSQMVMNNHESLQMKFNLINITPPTQLPRLSCKHYTSLRGVAQTPHNMLRQNKSMWVQTEHDQNEAKLQSRTQLCLLIHTENTRSELDLWSSK